MQWKHSASHATNKTKVVLLAGKGDKFSFCNAEGIVFINSIFTKALPSMGSAVPTCFKQVQKAIKTKRSGKTDKRSFVSSGQCFGTQVIGCVCLVLS